MCWSGQTSRLGETGTESYWGREPGRGRADRQPVPASTGPWGWRGWRALGDGREVPRGLSGERDRQGDAGSGSGIQGDEEMVCQVEGRGRSCVISNARDPLNLLSCQGTVLGSGTSRCHQRLQGPPAGGAPGWTAKLPVHRERASKALGGEESVQKHRETGVSKLGPRLPALKCWGDKGEMAKEGRLLRREKEGEGSGGHTEGACTHVTRIGQHAPNDKTLGHRSRVLGAVGRRPEWGGA